MMMDADRRMFTINARPIIGSRTLRGGWRMMSASTGSTPRLQHETHRIKYGERVRNSIAYLCAGGPSMMMLIQRICIAFSGFSKPKSVESAIRVRAETLLKHPF